MVLRRRAPPEQLGLPFAAPLLAPSAPFVPKTPPKPAPSLAPPADPSAEADLIEPAAPLPAPLDVEVQVNNRLRRTFRWRILGDRLVVERPAKASAREVEATVERIRERAAAYLQRQTAGTDTALLTRARRLLERYFPERPALRGVSWSARQHKRHGSCTPDSGTIRLATHLQRLPPWVLDYVLVHELTHLLHADHSVAFWSVVSRYPLAERARGFLLACDLGLAADEAPSAEP